MGQGHGVVVELEGVGVGEGGGEHRQELLAGEIVVIVVTNWPWLTWRCYSRNCLSNPLF